MCVCVCCLKVKNFPITTLLQVSVSPPGKELKVHSLCEDLGRGTWGVCVCVCVRAHCLKVKNFPITTLLQVSVSPPGKELKVHSFWVASWWPRPQFSPSGKWVEGVESTMWDLGSPSASSASG